MSISEGLCLSTDTAVDVVQTQDENTMEEPSVSPVSATSSSTPIGDASSDCSSMKQLVETQRAAILPAEILFGKIPFWFPGRPFVRRIALIVVRQVGLVALFFIVYTLSRGVGIWAYDDPVTVAERHREWIIDAEKFLHVYNERQIALWVLDDTSDAFKIFISYFYLLSHFSVTTFFYAFVCLFRPMHYPIYMTGFWISSFAGAICYMAFPMAPPRGYDGIPDILDEIGLNPHGDESAVQALANPHAAMPSLHFGWSVCVGLGLIYCVRDIPMRPMRRALVYVAGIGYPSFMLFVIVGTGNHYWMDALGGALVLAFGFGIAFIGFHKFDWNDYERNQDKYWFWDIEIFARPADLEPEPRMSSKCIQTSSEEERDLEAQASPVEFKAVSMMVGSIDPVVSKSKVTDEDTMNEDSV